MRIQIKSLIWLQAYQFCNYRISCSFCSYNKKMNLNQFKTKLTLAIPFISFNQGKGFTLNPEAEQFLMSLSPERELGIVSIVGKYRTGKSFFVNRVLLDQKNSGFQVGPTINPCTKGLWLWKKTIISPTNPNMDIIVIDTQGFGGMDQNANHDSRIFLFSLLLSSYFIYNSVGSIDENALNSLNLIINLAKDIQLKTNNNTNEDASYFPSFLWVVRDFTLQIVDKHGDKINSKEYLENALELQKGGSDAVQSKNKIRRLVKHFFQDRDCITMVRPVQREKDLQRLDQMDNNDLRPEFLQQVHNIRTKIFSRVRPKAVNGNCLSGNLLVGLCKGYMEAINKGAVPNVQSAWFYVCRNQGVKAIEDSMKMLEKQIQGMQEMGEEELCEVKQKIRLKITKRFKEKAMGSQETHPDLVERLQKKMNEAFKQMQEKNNEMILEKCKAKSETLLDEIRTNVYMSKYNSFADFTKDLEKAKAQYSQISKSYKSSQKWLYFNQLTEEIYKLAGESICEKITNSKQIENITLKQQIQKKEEELKEKTKQLIQQKSSLNNKLHQVERKSAYLAVSEVAKEQQINKCQQQYNNLHKNYQQLKEKYQQKVSEVDSLRQQLNLRSINEIQSVKTQANIAKSNLQKQRTLFQMETKYINQQLQKYKSKCQTLQAQFRKIKLNNVNLTSQIQQNQTKIHQQQQELDTAQHTVNLYHKKIQALIAQNNQKTQMIGQHNQWILEKSYLQNQVSFLKNTLSENKRLHDALLVALQQSIASSEGQSNHELIQANKNLSSALEKIESRCKILEEKYDKVKHFKKIIKSCSAMQCSHCNQWIPTDHFSEHMAKCQHQKDLTDQNNRSHDMHITVSQTIVKNEQSNKPYTEYIVQMCQNEKKWKVSKRYKQFGQLQQSLINKYPYIKYPQSCNLFTDVNSLVSNKRTIMAEERRKHLQGYLNDLYRIEEIRNSQIFRHFFQIDNETPLKVNKTKFNK